MTSRQDSVQPAKPLPMRGALHVRVRYCECDPMGVAHHAAYAPWLEMARTEMLRGSGVTYAAMERAGVYLVVARMEISYRRPVYYDDEVEVRTEVVGGSRVKIEHRYDIVLGHAGERVSVVRQPGEVLTVASTTLVCVDREGKVRPLPEWLTAERHQ
jgi:acyl-CoA thioester hydrolase